MCCDRKNPKPKPWWEIEFHFFLVVHFSSIFFSSSSSFFSIFCFLWFFVLFRLFVVIILIFYSFFLALCLFIKRPLWNGKQWVLIYYSSLHKLNISYSNALDIFDTRIYILFIRILVLFVIKPFIFVYTLYLYIHIEEGIMYVGYCILNRLFGIILIHITKSYIASCA